MERDLFNMYGIFKERNNSIKEDSCVTENSNKDTDCSCPLAMVFINSQPIESVYPLAEAFCEGTLFPNLNKPFLGGMLK